MGGTAEPITSHRRSAGRPSRYLDELSPFFPLPQHPLTVGCPNWEFCFLDELKPESSKATWEGSRVSHSSFMVAVRINPLDCFECHQKDLEQRVIKGLVIFPTRVHCLLRIPDQETTFCSHFSCELRASCHSCLALTGCRVSLAGL